MLNDSWSKNFCFLILQSHSHHIPQFYNSNWAITEGCFRVRFRTTHSSFLHETQERRIVWFSYIIFIYNKRCCEGLRVITPAPIWSPPTTHWTHTIEWVTNYLITCRFQVCRSHRNDLYSRFDGSTSWHWASPGESQVNHHPVIRIICQQRAPDH